MSDRDHGVFQALLFLATVAMILTSCASPPDGVVEVYQTYRQALESRDLAALKQVISETKAAELDSVEPEALDILAMLAPTAPEIVDVETGESRAKIRLEGAIETQPMKGTITLVKESGEWKVLEESWELSMHNPGPMSNLASELDSSTASHFIARSRMRGHEGIVRAIQFTPDGNSIVSASWDDYTLRLWSVWDGMLQYVVDLENRPADMEITPDGLNVAVVDAKGEIRLYPLEYASFGAPTKLPGHAGRQAQLTISADGTILAATGYDLDVRTWDLVNGTPIESLPGTDQKRGIDFSPDGHVLAIGGYGNTFTVWDLDGTSLLGRNRRQYKIPKVGKQSDVWSVAFGPEGKRVVTGHMDSSVTLWDIEKGKPLINTFVQNASTHHVCFGSDGTVFASAHQNGWVFLWDPEKGTRLASIEAHNDGTHSLAFSPQDGTVFATGGGDGTIIVWGLESELAAR